jgi:hypothetical protein
VGNHCAEDSGGVICRDGPNHNAVSTRGFITIEGAIFEDGEFEEGLLSVWEGETLVI